jgi:type II secretory pathway pseudopilin PulG
MKKSFTIIELLLVIVIITTLLASSISVGSGMLVRNYAINTNNELISALRTAQLNSLSGKSSSNWGVKVTSSEIILFKGATYSVGTPFDQKYAIPQGITVSIDEVYFDKLSGNPNKITSFTISFSGGTTKTISVNRVGTVNVN